MLRAMIAVVLVGGFSSCVLAQGVAPMPAPAGQEAAGAHARAAAMIDKSIAYLRSQQDQGSGGWAVNPQGPNFPAVTGLVVSGMLMDPRIDDSDPKVAMGVKFMLGYAQPDGGIYDKILPSYNTAICLAALSQVSTPPQVADVVKKAQEFLRTLQYGEEAVVHEGSDESAKPVTKEDPFYGGAGYGRHGRPDLSNLAWVLEGLHASGVDSKDAAFQRALVFLQRTQMVEVKDGVKINDMAYAKGSRQGGFIYATSVDRERVGVGQSMAGEIEETLSDGTTASRLRAYGSMTYSGFKSYLYAGLRRGDPRMVAAMEWISRNYTLEENPGLGTDGMYYYYVVFARAMDAYGEPTISTIKADGTNESRRWAQDLVDRLAKLQNEDGSFKSVDDRWMENNPVLITAYALIALQHAEKDLR